MAVRELTPEEIGSDADIGSAAEVLARITDPRVWMDQIKAIRLQMEHPWWVKGRPVRQDKHQCCDLTMVVALDANFGEHGRSDALPYHRTCEVCGRHYDSGD